MSDSINLIHLFDEVLDADIHRFNPPHRISEKSDETGKVYRRFYDWETCDSPRTSAGFHVRAIPKDPNHHVDVAGYEVDANIPACLIGRNHLLVNGVYRAAEGAVELLRNYAATSCNDPDFLRRFTIEKTRLKSATLTFLFIMDSPEEAKEGLDEFRRHADAVLNHVLPPRRKKSKAPCYTVGADDCYTLYIKQRTFKVSAYIKQPNVPGAFAQFPSPEVEAELTELAARTVRVEVQVLGAWLRDEELDCPTTWSMNPEAYAKVFQLAVDVLRLDEDLRVRLPTEEAIAKLPPDHQIILRDHLAGANIREHELVLDCAGTVEQVIDAQNKKFSAFKRRILEEFRIDISIPWVIQSEGVSLTLKTWFKFRGEFQPGDSLKWNIFSRATGKGANADLRSAAENSTPEEHKIRLRRRKTDPTESDDQS